MATKNTVVIQHTLSRWPRLVESVM